MASARPATSRVSGSEHGPALLDLLGALVGLHGLDANRVGHDQEGPEQPLLGSPQAADLGAYALRPALALPDEAVDEQQRDEKQDDQQQDQQDLERRAAQDAPHPLEQIHGRRPRSTPRRQHCLAAALVEVAAPRRAKGDRSGSDPGRQPTYRWLCRRAWGPHFSIGSAVVSQPSLVTVTT